MPSTKKQIIIAVILALLGIAMILLLMRFFQGSPANELIFLREKEEYTKTVYQVDDMTLSLKNEEELKLNLIIYIPEKEELQFGFVLPETEEGKDTEPFQMAIVDAQTGATVSEKPIYIRELRDGNCYYRAIFLDAPIDVETSPDLKLEISSPDGTELYSEVFIQKSTLFVEKSLNDLPVADDRITLVDPGATSSAAA